MDINECCPETVVWEYTLRCNSKCIHCGSDAVNERQDELTGKHCLNLVDQLADIGCRKIILSGGEPTLREDWYDTGKRIKERGIDFGIISNALAWKNKTFDLLEEIKPFGVGFSVDGEPELHDYLRGIKGSHKKVFEAVKELNNRKVGISVITSVNNLNIDQLKQIRNRLIVYGIGGWQIQIANPMGRMKEHPELVLTEENYYKLGEFISRARKMTPGINLAAADCMGYFGTLESQLREKEWAGCSAGTRTLGIDSDGGIRACLSIRDDRAIGGNIKERSLKDIWFDKNNFSFNRNFKKENLKGICSGCKYGEKCRGGCQSSSTSFLKEFHNAPFCLQDYEKRQNK